MTTIRNQFIILVLFLGGFMVGCQKNSNSRLSNPLPSGAVPSSAGTFTIFKNELMTGGGVAFIPGGENQSANFQDQSAPQRNHWQIRYEWNGGEVMNGAVSQHLYAGFIFPVTVTAAQLTTATGKNLSGAAYNKVKFWVRGTLSAGNSLRVEGPTDNNTTTVADRVELTSDQVTSDWQEHTFSLTPARLNDVKIFLTVTLQYEQTRNTTNNGLGGVIYLDDIRYVKE